VLTLAALVAEPTNAIKTLILQLLDILLGLDTY